MSDNTRWWDHYYVRYFVGAIFGVALLLWLQQHALVCTCQQCKFDDMSKAIEATALGTIGLAFCYLASAPVLVVHALRFSLSKDSRLFGYLGIAVAIVVVVVGALLLLWGVYARANDSMAPKAWLQFIPFAVVLAPQVFLLVLFYWRTDAIRERYLKLSRDRSGLRPTLYGKEKRNYIESYRHLREHGNAYAILLAEVILAAAIDRAPSWYFVGGLIALWILPAAFVWFIATWLEFGIDRL